MQRSLIFIQVKQTVLESKFDILTISESWLDNSITNLELEIPGYDLYRVDRHEKKAVAFVFIFYRTTRLMPVSISSGLRSKGATFALLSSVLFRGRLMYL